MSDAQAEQEPAATEEEAEALVGRRIWCITQATHVALNVAARAPTLPTIDILKTAEEMLEFLETGVARSHREAATKQ